MTTVQEFYEFVNGSKFAEEFAQLNRDSGEFYNTFEKMVEDFELSKDETIKFVILNTVERNGSHDERASLELEVVAGKYTLLFLFNKISEEFLKEWLNR